MTHAIEILQDRQASLRGMIRAADEMWTIHGSGPDSNFMAVLNNQLSDVRRAISFLESMNNIRADTPITPTGGLRP